MPSSTFNSKPPLFSDDRIRSEGRCARRAAIFLIALIAALLSIAELSARYLFPRISQVQRRIEQDRCDALAIGMPGPGARPAVLVVGNSLLLFGLDYPRIRSALAPDVVLVRYSIESTQYLDWYYGLRHLFAKGIRPAATVVCLNLVAMVSSEVRDDYSARYLFAARDLLTVSRDANLDNTETSSLIYAHWSAFYGGRATIRNFIVNATEPGYAELLHEMAFTRPEYPPASELIARTGVRLQTLDSLCRANGSKFIFLIPPSLNRADALLLEAGRLAHVDVEMPLALGSIDASWFLDGFHVNPKGARLFTEKLAPVIRSHLSLPVTNHLSAVQAQVADGRVPK